MSCTVISMVPFPVPNIHKPGLIPPYYTIPSGAEDLGILVVENGKRGLYLVDADRWQDIDVPAEHIAKSIVGDFLREQICVDIGNAEPGLFWVDGTYTDSKMIKTAFAKELEKAKQLQTAWFHGLVFVADDDYKRTGMRRSVTDLQILAAKALGLNREWISRDPGSMIKCPSCTTMISTDAAVCFACKLIVNPEKYASFKYATT